MLSGSFVYSISYDIVHSRVAARAPKSARPTRSLDRLGTLRLSSNATKERRNGHAGLKMDLVEVHRARSVTPSGRRDNVTSSLAHRVSLPRWVSNQELESFITQLRTESSKCLKKLHLI